ncbi:hypothetical protein ANN_27485, partial [Periplaneta americana]
ERNSLNQHVTDIKEEYVNQCHDLVSEVKCEKDPVAISFPVVKREPEEEQTDSDAVNEEPRVEVTAEDNEVLKERLASTNERNVSSELDSLSLEENETVCETPKNSDSIGKAVRTGEGEKQLELESSKKCFSTAEKLNDHLSTDIGKKPFKCDVCGRCFSDWSSKKP